MLASGTRLGGVFDILDPIGAGGMGEVYRARDTKLGRDVAVKVLPRDVAADSERLSRFEHEARNASALNHPNIVTVHDIGRDGDLVYQVLELVAGRTLRDLLAKGLVPQRQVLQIAEQVAAGLAAAHAAGIVHRDLKPENVMLRDDGVVKILDFGLAKQLAPGPGGETQLATATAITSPGAILGTVGYMSPEQARGDAVDFRADQFALGAVLYEMLAGARPFRGDSAAQTLSAIIEKEPEPVSRSRDDVPRPCVWILDRCLAKDPRDRYASTLDLARDLRNVREHLSEISTSRVTAPPARRRRHPVLLAAVACTIAGAAMGWFLGHRGGGVRAPGEPIKLRTITFSGQDYMPAASPDGRTLAFVSLRDGTPRIWLKSLAEGSEAPLTKGIDYRPRFSPDGAMVLFVRDEGGTTALYRVATLGGEPRRIVNDAVEGEWSPDGTSIVFVRTVAEGEHTRSLLVVAGADGGGERVLADLPDAVVVSPRWSPDGQWIAASVSTFGASESTGKVVQLVRADGSETRRLRPETAGGDVSGVAWLANGEVLYAQGESVSTISLGGGVVAAGASRIVRQAIGSGASRVVFWTPSLSTMVDVVGPGHVVFDAILANQNLQEFDVSTRPATTLRLLSQGSSLDRQPVYTPDGEWVVFSSNRSGNLDIWARSTQNGDLRRLTDHPADDWDPALTRDGRSLIWTSRRGGNFEIWMSNADGTGARQVTRDSVDAENATSTPDGEWLVYNSANPAKLGIWKIRTDGSQATHLVQGNCAWPEVSPDGRYASFAVPLTSAEAAIRVVRLADGVIVPFEIRLAAAELPNGRTRWFPDGKTLAFSWNAPTFAGIYAQDFGLDAGTESTRRAVVSLEPGAVAETFGISQDGTRLILAASRRTYSLMSAENVAGIVPARRTP